MTTGSRLLSHLGDKIRVERTRREYSQEELAEKAGVHRTYIGMIERGEKNITILNLAKVALALRLRVRDLVDF